MNWKTYLVAVAMAMPVWAMAQNSLLGQWVMPVPNNAQCSEYYRFNDNGHFYVNSGQEQVEGRFAISKTLGLPQLDFLFSKDNGMGDCFGNNQDQTGTRDTHFLKWHSENQVELCADVLGQNCHVRLYRQ